MARVTPVPVLFKEVKNCVSKVFSLLSKGETNAGETSASRRTLNSSLALRACNSMGNAVENDKSEKIATIGRYTNFMDERL